MPSADGSALWEVKLPESKESNSFSRRPRAEVLWHGADGEEAFSVPRAVGKLLAKERESLSVGSRAELLFRIREASESCAWDRFLKLVALRDYASKEIEDKLAMDGYSKACIQTVIERAVNGHLLDDTRFADIYIRSKVLSGWGSARIVRELKLKGIEASSIPGWPYEYLPEDEYDRALELARTRRESQRRSYEKLARYLSSRGFSASVCARVASRVVSEANDEPELT